MKFYRGQRVRFFSREKMDDAHGIVMDLDDVDGWVTVQFDDEDCWRTYGQFAQSQFLSAVE